MLDKVIKVTLTERGEGRRRDQEGFGNPNFLVSSTPASPGQPRNRLRCWSLSFPRWPRARDGVHPINAGGCDGLPPHRGCRLRTQLRFKGRRPGHTPAVHGESLAWQHPTRFPNPSGPQPAATFLGGGVGPDSIASSRPVVLRAGPNGNRSRLASDSSPRARTPSDIAFQLVGVLLSSVLPALQRHQARCLGVVCSLINKYIVQNTECSNQLLFAASLRDDTGIRPVCLGPDPSSEHGPAGTASLC